MGFFDRGNQKQVTPTDLEKRFHLIGRVGQGSMSRVWKADDHVSGKRVAVKILDQEKTEAFEARFKGLNKPHEGEIATSLHHPYIVNTTEFGITTDGEMFLVMDFVEGSGLSLLVDLQNEEFRRYRTRYMIQIGEALSYLHRNKWIHRDLCPRNILVSDTHQVRLIDFGLVVPDTPDFRKPGNRTGTANYLAPELIKRKPTDTRLDVFSYAVTCFEMYSKRHPWEAALTLDAVLQHINKPPLKIEELVPEIDSEIAVVINKGLEREPDDRWQTVDEMVEEFRRIERRLVSEAHEYLAARQGVTVEEIRKQIHKQNARPERPGGAALPEAAAVAAAPAPGETSEKAAAKKTKKGKGRRKRKTQNDDDLAASFLMGDDD